MKQWFISFFYRVKLRSSYSVMKYHKEGSVFICQADCKYLADTPHHEMRSILEVGSEQLHICSDIGQAAFGALHALFG